MVNNRFVFSEEQKNSFKRSIFGSISTLDSIIIEFLQQLVTLMQLILYPLKQATAAILSSKTGSISSDSAPQIA